LINEALLELNHHGKGPVHINVPISEPLFQFTTPLLEEIDQAHLSRYHHPLAIFVQALDQVIIFPVVHVQATRGVRLAGKEVGAATGNTYGSR